MEQLDQDCQFHFRKSARPDISSSDLFLGLVKKHSKLRNSRIGCNENQEYLVNSDLFTKIKAGCKLHETGCWKRASGRCALLKIYSS